MYKCERCGRPLNEFDVGFSERLSEVGGNRECKCFRCTTGKSANEFGRKLGKIIPFRIEYIDALKGTLVLLLLMIVATLLSTIDVGLSMFGGLINIICILVFIIMWIATTLELAGAGSGELRETGEHYETTLNSDGTIVTKKVTEYSDSGSALELLCLLGALLTPVLYPIIYLMTRIFKPYFGTSKMLKKYPRPVIDAYNYTYNATKHAKTSETVFLEYRGKIEKNNKKINDIQKKYSIMGENAVNEQLRKICPPIVSVNAGGEKYVIAHFVEDRFDYRCYLIRKNSIGEIEGKVVMNDYFVCSDTNDWREDWATIDGGVALELVERLKNHI